ncbi:MAG: cytochrome c [Acidobacteriota bacterium]|nr:cytochrome c [Acidobacteriota bacterium]
MPTLPSRLLTAILIVLVAGALAISYLAFRFTQDKSAEYSDAVEHFKYGSTGGERTSGIPYSVWKALPSLFPEYMPAPGANFASFGFLYEKEKDLPIGISKRNYRGIDVVFFNCAICHMGSVRDTAQSEPNYIAGMPSNTVDLRRFYQFLFDIVADKKFTPQRILLQSAYVGAKEDLLNRVILRRYALYLMREQLLDRKQRLGFILDEPEFGPGRIDTFSPAKALLNFRMDKDKVPARERIGTSDLPSIWNQRKRKDMWLHWDGNNNKVEERNRSAAFGTGATPTTLDRRLIHRVEGWINEAKPPAYPYAKNPSLAAQGQPLYERYCADCHGRSGTDFTGARVGRVTSIHEVGTDPHRLDSYTYDLAAVQNTLYAGYGDERFSHFRKTFGYANAPLDGIWLRAPYCTTARCPRYAIFWSPWRTGPNPFIAETIFTIA